MNGRDAARLTLLGGDVLDLVGDRLGGVVAAASTVCIAIIFIMSPCTLILPAMNACMPAAWSWSTNSLRAVS